MKAARKEVLAVPWGGIGQQIADCCSGLFGDLELDRSPGFLLDYRGAVLHPLSLTRSRTRSQPLSLLSMARLNKARSRPLFKLEPDPNCPDLLRSQRTFLTNEATLVAGSFGKADK
jgi:hypothetical protein